VTSPVAVLWYRQDLRLADLPALHAAARDGQAVLPVFILDDAAAGEWAPGAASRWWLHHSLEALAADIRERGGALILRRGDSAEVLAGLCESCGARTVYCSRRYEPWAAKQEKAVHDALAGLDIELKRHGGGLLHEPGTVLTQSGDPYKVFTPFWRACRAEPIAPPRPIPEIRWAGAVASDALEDWALTPRAPDWAAQWKQLWTPGEAGASERLREFLEDDVDDYGRRRDLPAEAGTSRLSPHLHHGELSPRQVWALCEQRKNRKGTSDKNIEKFQSELGWREFSYHLLHFFPTITNTVFKSNFSAFPWSRSQTRLEAWQRGNTGYPIVDAGMRELWATGYMHNRVRMIVASFLCKHLLINWREGEDWFWDTLVDADLASNSASWQWVAGSGADAAPYFRIFNPMTQGEKFDKNGTYVRRWVPELAELPDKHLHTPWEAPDAVLESAGVKLGETYPEPIVDHREARQAALDAYDTIKLSKASSS
jgi:deoxyribodipyrimidine photo-lyase